MIYPEMRDQSPFIVIVFVIFEERDLVRRLYDKYRRDREECVATETNLGGVQSRGRRGEM